MKQEFFYDHKRLGTMKLEHSLHRFESFDEFEQAFTEEFLNEDNRVGDYLSELVYKYDQKASVVIEHLRKLENMK